MLLNVYYQEEEEEEKDYRTISSYCKAFSITRFRRSDGKASRLSSYHIALPRDTAEINMFVWVCARLQVVPLLQSFVVCSFVVCCLYDVWEHRRKRVITFYDNKRTATETYQLFQIAIGNVTAILARSAVPGSLVLLTIARRNRRASWMPFNQQKRILGG